jgi:hypothetical protein
LIQELYEVREGLDAQGSLGKRQRAEMEAMTHEMNALKVRKNRICISFVLLKVLQRYITT